MSRRFFLCDQSLKSYSGHCYEYFRPLITLLRERGDQVVLIGNKDLEPDFARTTETIPLFTYWCDEMNIALSEVKAAVRYALIVQEHERAIIDDFSRIDAEYSFGPCDTIVLNSARHWILKGLFRWLEGVPQACRPDLVLLLHFTASPIPGEYHPSKKVYQDAFAYLETSAAKPYIHLLADSRQLIEEYESYTSIPVALSPFPHTARRIQYSRPPDRENMNVGYIGEARVHKGFHLLPSLAKSVQNHKVHFHIHAFCFNPQAEFYKAALLNLERCANVTLYYDLMNPDEYEAFLDKIDISLIPYSLDNYYKQTSGIYAESIALGKPVIVSRGTWMADQLAQFGGGEACIANDYMSLVDSVDRVCDRFEYYRSAALAAAQRWNSIHNPERLMLAIEHQISLSRPTVSTRNRVP